MNDVVDSVMNKRTSKELATLGIYELFKDDFLDFNIKDSDYFTFAYCEYIGMDRNCPPILSRLNLDFINMRNIKEACININKSFGVSNLNSNQSGLNNQRNLNNLYSNTGNQQINNPNSGRRLGVKRYE